MASSDQRKVVKYKKTKHINISSVILIVILIYVLLNLITYFTSKKIVGYEVKTGSLSTNNVFQGIALREEEIVPSNYAGYVNYYNKEGDRLGVGNLAYTVDESGMVMDTMNSDETENDIPNEDLHELETDIISFTSTFDRRDFASVYDFKGTVLSTVQKLSNGSVLDQLAALSKGADANSVHYCYAEDTGDVIYSTDGYETKTFDTLTKEDFDKSKYEKKQLESNQLIAIGDPAYKLSTEEKWSITIMTDEEKAEELLDLEYVKVRFLKNQYESWASVTKRTDEDNNIYINLAFTNSMVSFVTDRFIDIELITEERQGLKVPNSAIVESNFFLVPKEYLTVGTGGKKGVLREVYMEDGTKSSQFVEATPYSETETDYYLDQNALRVGDVLIQNDQEGTFTISPQDKLVGVYNINKGYADFRLINVLYKNEEYSIVQSNTLYGLSEYDYIVLDASTINPEELVYD